MNSKSTGTRMRYCHGNSPLEHQLSHKSSLCKFSSDSKIGVTVHMSREQPAQYHENLKEKGKNFKRIKTEYEYFTEIVRDLIKNKIQNVNKAAADKLGRTEQRVAKIRTLTNYKRAELRVKEKFLRKETTEIRD